MSSLDPTPSALPRDFEVDPGPVKSRIRMGVVLLLVVFGALVATVTGMPFAHLPGPPVALPLMIAVQLALVGLMAYLAVITFVAVPRMRFHVGARRFEVRTLFFDRHWPTQGLVAREHVPHFELRLMGTAMAGYLTGWFLMDGKRTLVYATGRGRGILLETQGARLFVTPADREGMLDSLRLAGASVMDGALQAP